MQQNEAAKKAVGQEKDNVTRLSRSPHPYSRRGSQGRFSLNLPQASTNSRLKPIAAQRGPSAQARERRRSPQPGVKDGILKSPEISSSEAEDEHIPHLKALPPPALKPRKGLRIRDDITQGDGVTPLLTPSELVEQEELLTRGYFVTGATHGLSQGELERARIKFFARRRAELLRRACELLLLVAMILVVLNGRAVSQYAKQWSNGLIMALIVVGMLVALYPVRLLMKPFLEDRLFKVGKIQVPSAFDPAPILYPLLVTILVSLSIAPGYPAVVIPNLLLSLSTLPSQLVPSFGDYGAMNPLHWALVSLVSATVSTSDAVGFSGPKGIANAVGTSSENLILLYPLHQSLLPILGSLTTTSLLSSELQLLSVGLINLLLLSDSPQIRILSILLWTGGIGLLVLCSSIVSWNIDLERIDLRELRRSGQAIGVGGKSFITTLTRSLSHIPQENENDGRDDHPEYMGQSSQGLKSSNMLNGTSNGTGVKNAAASDEKRRPMLSQQRGRSRSAAMKTFTLTPGQIELRKWFFAALTYVVAVVLILGPIRLQVESALYNHEPFGWALGYLFGDLSPFRDFVLSNSFEPGIPLPNHLTIAPPSSSALVPSIRYTLGLSTTRLLLFAYWAFTIALGITTVLHLSIHVEVDTRRKVFHGMMVLMLLPTAYIDPAFLSLALALVLAVFLLLDFIRAAQLRPLSQPLARFLTPYVDGRDLKGPVVVSHIFLLIGCAIPLWLSMASMPRAGGEPWVGWEVVGRDVSMVAGVVCVGMGDAAASLVGRRFGRRKWPWAGGKSLEGSAAFAVAVTVGLGIGKLWLRGGGWDDEGMDEGIMVSMAKIALAATGASFTEAVLTGCNDNVVVPVVLWLLVRGLRL